MTVTLSIYTELDIDVPPGSPDPGQVARDIFKTDAAVLLSRSVDAIDVVSVNP